MDIRNAAIYEIPMNGASLKYASGQKYVTTRGMKSILVLTDTAPKVKFRKLEEGGELNSRETGWAFAAIADIMRESGDTHVRDRISGFLEKLEAELEKKRSKAPDEETVKGGV